MTKALSIDPGHSAARVSLAGVHRYRHRRGEAIALLHEVTTDAPQDFSGHYWLAADALLKRAAASLDE